MNSTTSSNTSSALPTITHETEPLNPELVSSPVNESLKIKVVSAENLNNIEPKDVLNQSEEEEVYDFGIGNVDTIYIN